MSKPQETKVKVKDLSTAIKALETLQDGREKGKFDFDLLLNILQFPSIKFSKKIIKEYKISE